MHQMIHFRCPSCGARIRAGSSLIGQQRPCPGCGHNLLIQAEPPRDSGPVLLEDGVPFPTISSRAAQAGEKVILLVDDDRALNDGLRSLLEKRGHRVIQAFNGVQAREIIRHERPDLVILDVLMPRLGGIPLLEYCCEKGYTPPVLVISAQDGPALASRVQYPGILDYLHKPFASERLLERVATRLESRADEAVRPGEESNPAAPHRAMNN